MRIRIEKSCAGSEYVYGKGTELEVGAEIPRARALSLLNSGTASPIDDVGADTADYPLHTGAGWYRLSNGQKVRGKDAAEQEQEALNGAG